MDNLKEILDLHKNWLNKEEGGKRAYLQGANLQRANLQGANLKGAYLQGADLWGAVGDMYVVRSIQLETYPITYTSEVMQIGCKRYTFDEWRNFTDQEILEMNGKTALKWWRKWKDWIFQTVEMCPAEPTGEDNNG